MKTQNVALFPSVYLVQKLPLTIQVIQKNTNAVSDVRAVIPKTRAD